MAERGVAARAGEATQRAVRWTGRLLRGQVVQAVGGPARTRVVLLFGAVLALNSADTATIGAVAPQLEQALNIGNAKIGLLSSAALLVGAVFVLPVGLLVDRTKRIPLLSMSIVLWSVAELAGALAGSYESLLLSRLALGAVTATAGPAIASLTGDYFPSHERGRVYAYILGGEIAGTAIGFIISGTVASIISWQAAFVVLALPGLWLARTLWRTVPEPRRGGQSRLHPGALTFTEGEATEVTRVSDAADGQAGAGGSGRGQARDEGELARETARARGVAPDPALILRQDPREMGVLRAIRYILSIPTNLLMIGSSALGYFFFSGLQTFVVVFMRGHYHISQPTATLLLAVLVIGSLAGTLISGRVTDALLRRGYLAARIWVPAICYLSSVVLLVPGILGKNITPALWFDVGGTALISAANPPLDAARLDIMPAGLWGRAESVRTFLRSLAQALAPLVFGGLADLVVGITPPQAPVGTHPGHVAPESARGLEVSFLIMLISLAAAGILLLRARVTYPTDVATAGVSLQGTEPPPRGSEQKQGPERRVPGG
jgi:MFS family permease